MILGLDPNFMSFGTSASHITMYDKMSLHQVASTQRTYYTHSVSFSMKSKLGLKQQDFFFFSLRLLATGPPNTIDVTQHNNYTIHA